MYNKISGDHSLRHWVLEKKVFIVQNIFRRGKADRIEREAKQVDKIC